MGDGALQAAHRQKEAGEFAEAGKAFADLAASASGRSEHGMATHLAYQAGKCLYRANDKGAAMAQIELAVGHAAASQQRMKFAHKFGRLVAFLRSQDMDSEADRVAELVKEKMGFNKMPKPAEAPPVNRAMRRALPKSCKTCGAPVKSDKVFFNDDQSADCRFCGSDIIG